MHIIVLHPFHTLAFLYCLAFFRPTLQLKPMPSVLGHSYYSLLPSPFNKHKFHLNNTKQQQPSITCVWVCACVLCIWARNFISYFCWRLCLFCALRGPTFLSPARPGAGSAARIRRRDYPQLCRKHQQQQQARPGRDPKGYKETI